MSDKTSLGIQFLKELEAEASATRKCLERISDDAFNWKPHEKSMSIGTLAFIVADIPRWITRMVKAEDIDFSGFKHEPAKNSADLVKFFDEHIKSASAALKNVSDQELEALFHLKNNGQVLMSIPKKDNIGSTINHLVHHRGQLTVFMRLKDIPVPAIYGPSADDKGF